VQSQVETPDELQLVTPDITCKAAKGVCVSPRLCTPQNGVHPITGSGCKSGTICCS
jgi:hypothetical protein